MMIIERQAAGGASTGSASGEAIEPTVVSRFLTNQMPFHTFVYLDPITDTDVPTASNPEPSVSSVSISSEVRILCND